jgi:glyoxylase-like metal-dependent hydrolase (beta-lactamase superfamily II)
MKPIALGDFTIRKFVESAGNMPVPAAAFDGLGGERFAALRTSMDPRCGDLDAENFFLSMHSFVLESGGRRILIDTCNGDGKHRTGVMAPMNMLKTDYIANLAGLGLKPEDIDVVVCTHLHSDHVGWNTKLENGVWVPTFPNARYLISDLDVQFYGALPKEHPQYALTREPFDDRLATACGSRVAPATRPARS